MAMNMQIGAVPKMKIKVCMVGDSGVGKTSLVRRYVLDFFDDRYIVTLGTKITKKQLLVKETPLGAPMDITLTLWDIMGQEGFRELLKESYFYGANGLLAVIDVTDAATLVSLKRWIDLAQSVTGRIPVHLVVNKVDLKDKAAVRPEDVALTANELGISFSFASAKTGEGVEDAFHAIASAIVHARFARGLNLRPQKPQQPLIH